MGIKEKIADAKSSDKLADGLTSAELKSIVELAQISAKIERRRIEMGMTQAEFAKFMGVSQGMVSKWESRGYNFTVKSLNEICEKIGLEFEPIVEKPRSKNDYTVLSWNVERKNSTAKAWKYVNSEKGAIA